MDTVDFVIPHMGRPELLADTVRSIMRQTCYDQIARITVVTRNDAPLDLPAEEKLHVIHAPEAPSISHQRNLGVAAGSSPLIAFLDADIELSPDWLETAIGLLNESSDRLLVSAMQVNSPQATRIEKLRTTLSNVALDTAVHFLPGRNLLVRRSAHDAIGGFPEHLQTCEDYYYTEKLSRLGELYYTSLTHYVHLGEDRTLGQTFRKEIWRSEYNLHSLAGRTVPLREWPSILLPFWMVLGFLLLVMSVVEPLLIAPALLMLSIPPLLYSARLMLKPGNQLSPAFLLVFYSVYFVARTAGTIRGVSLLFRRGGTA